MISGIKQKVILLSKKEFLEKKKNETVYGLYFQYCNSAHNGYKVGKWDAFPLLDSEYGDYFVAWTGEPTSEQADTVSFKY